MDVQYIRIETSSDGTLTKTTGYFDHTTGVQKKAPRVLTKTTSSADESNRILRRWLQAAVRNGFSWGPMPHSMPLPPRPPPAPPTFSFLPYSSVSSLPPPPSPVQSSLPPRPPVSFALYSRQRPPSHSHQRRHSHHHVVTSPPPTRRSTSRERKHRRAASKSQSPPVTSMKTFQKYQRAREQQRQPCDDYMMRELTLRGASQRRRSRGATVSCPNSAFSGGGQRRRRRSSGVKTVSTLDPVRYIRRPSRMVS